MKTQVSNFDVAGLCDRLTYFALEMKNSQSAFNGGFFLGPDRVRLATYLDRLDAFASAANVAPLDLPKIHNVGFSLLKTFPDDEKIESIENQDVKDIVRRFKALWVEMSESQSADLASGINRFDLVRLQGVITSCRALLELATESIDLPENVGNVPVPRVIPGSTTTTTTGNNPPF